MTQLEHFMYIRVLFQEADGYGQLTKVYDELTVYCDKFNADFGHTVVLL